jgi:hypothetical protein
MKKPEWHCKNLRKAHLGKSKSYKGKISPMMGKTHTSESK